MVVITIFSGFLTLLITIALQGLLGKYLLPYLSIPFVLTIWIVISASGMLHGEVNNEGGVYVLNKLFSIGGNPLVDLHQWWVSNVKSDFLNSYFMSLGAIFFQYNVFAGIVISVALFFYSRIAFLLSLVGYSVAYLAYSFFGMDMTQLGYNYIGFNFVLAAIAIGGYFYIPSRQSFFWAFAVTPVIALVAAGMFILLRPFNLTILSMPFNIILLIFIYSLRFRSVQKQFNEVIIQEGTPERNLYSYQSFTKRFPNYGWIQIKLPFLGEWYVSQGHEGEFTHKGDWSEAWDFVITDRESKQFESNGDNLKDYYCFGQNVIAPADGVVIISEDGIEDNRISEVNTLKNWGNTVIIRHAEGLYSKLSHLQKGSLALKAGDNVHYGQVIAKVGNSGRSPYPHLHFQLQSTPYIGSKTLKYPLFSYLENGREVKTFSYPEKGQQLKPIEVNIPLGRAFNLMPGTKLKWQINTSGRTEQIEWEVFTNPFNRSYIYCYSSKSTAYFQFDGVHFTFTHFDGKRNSLLYKFYLAAFNIPLVNIDGYLTTDNLQVNETFEGWRLFFHDFTAPFFFYLSSRSIVEMKIHGSPFDADSFEFDSTITGSSFNSLIWTKKFRIVLNRDNSLKFYDEELKLEATCEPF